MRRFFVPVRFDGTEDMPAGIIISRQNGDMREVASIVEQDGQPLVAEVCFDKAGRPFVPARATHNWEVQEDFETAIRETYKGVEDERLPDDVKSLPVGRREDFVKVFNEYVYWYWKSDDDDYDENKPLHVNAVSYALKKAYAAIETAAKEEESAETSPHADGTEKVGESAPGGGEKVPLKEDGVGFVRAGSFEEGEKGYKVPLQIIQAGWSLNGNYYTKEAVEDIARLVANKIPGYFNHGDNNRHLLQWNQVIEDAWVDGDTVQGKAHIFQYPDGEALKERIDYVKENDALHLFGVSIDGFAKVEEGSREGRKGRIVSRVIAMHSVDVVMSPAANGRWGKVTASVTQNETSGEFEEEAKTMDLETLKKDHPELANALVEEGREEVREGDLKTAQESVDTLQTENETLKGDITGLKSKVETYELAEAQVEFKAKVETHVGEALKETPNLITDVFVENLVDLGSDQWEKIEKLVEERKTLQVSGPQGMGKEDEEKEEVSESKEETKEAGAGRLASFQKSTKFRRFGG
jgi:hypothetical protein